MARRSSQKQRRVDPNAPKKPAAAWRLFFMENRDEITKQNPGASYAEISKKLGEMWRNTDQAAKRRYEEEYQTNQEEYKEKLSIYRTEQKNKKRGSSANTKKQNDENNNNNES